MAVMKRPVGDLMSGKLGNVVFVQTKNKSYVRLAPVRKLNNWSEQQLMYRKRMSKVSGLWRSLKSNLTPHIWNNVDENMNVSLSSDPDFVDIQWQNDPNNI